MNENVTGARLRRRLLDSARLAAACILLVVAIAPSAHAQTPPVNDNYLDSLQIVDEATQAFPVTWQDTRDTAAATTQLDLFSPHEAGGGLEPDRCTDEGPLYGRTVWYDFEPPLQGGVEIQTSGYDTAVAVYEWDPATRLIAARVLCQDDEASPGEDVLVPRVRRGVNYTVQVGAVAPPGGTPVGGLLGFSFLFLADTDRDGMWDIIDSCDRLRGIASRGGCPPELDTNPQLALSAAAGGVRVLRLSVAGVPARARVEARCRRCDVRQVVRAKRRGTVRLPRLSGTFVPSGASIEVLVTLKRQPSGRFRFGAIGNLYRYRVDDSRVRPRIKRCLPVDSRKPKRRCT